MHDGYLAATSRLHVGYVTVTWRFLIGTDVFGNEELEHLLQYMRVVCPMSLTRYVNAMQESEGFTTGTPHPCNGR